MPAAKKKTKPSHADLTLGPILFHWPAEQWRDFYFRMADEAPVNTVYVGEVVCSKRAPLNAPYFDVVRERLQKAGKTVVRASLAQVALDRDRQLVAQDMQETRVPVEVNDISAFWHLAGRPCCVGPFLNVYSEDSLAFVVRKGATHVTLSPELPESALAVLGPVAKKLGVTLEIQVFGRMPLALSARCYHARAQGRIKDTCRYACAEDADGMALETLEGEAFLSINGIQTLSHTCLNLLPELSALRKIGFSAFRLSPHSGDMVAVAKLFRAVLDGTWDPVEASAALKELLPENMPFSNGFFHKAEGWRWVA